MRGSGLSNIAASDIAGNARTLCRMKAFHI